MKLRLKGRRFQDVTEIQDQSLTVLHAIPKKSVPAVLPAVAEKVDPLHKLGRGILYNDISDSDVMKDVKLLYVYI
jgi:hypothetical protein